MSDLISRAEIISTFAELGKTGRYGGMCEWVIEIVEQLPPAELSTNLASLGKDCISRQAAIDAIRTVIGDNRSISVCEAVKKLPPIQLRREERKNGEWIYDWGDWDFETCKCSECGNHMTTPIGKRYNFCPNCGADMREVTT